MSWIERIISDYGMSAMFLLIFLEYACFPVSSEIILPLAGLAGAGSGMPFAVLVLISAAAGLAGTSVTYTVGRLGGSPLLEKAMRHFPSLKKPVLASYRAFGRHGKGAVFLSRLIPLCRTYIGFVAGAMKQSLIHYLFCSALGILIWNTALTALGYYFYRCRHVFFVYFARGKKWIFIIASLLLLIFLARKLTRRKKCETDRE